MSKDTTNRGARLCAPTETDTSNLPELPRGWVWTRLGDITNFEYGKALREDKRDQSGEVPVYGSNGVVGYHSVPLVGEPCLVVGRKGAAGRVSISPGPCWAIDTTYYVVPPEEIGLHFSYYLFSTLNLASLDKSTAIPGLNRNDAYAIPIPLPPLAEQQRIVSKIEELFTELDAGVEALKKVKAQLKRYRQAVLKHAFEGNLTAEWREAHKGELEPASLLLERIRSERAKNLNVGAHSRAPRARAPRPYNMDTSSLPQLPQGWVWTMVEDLANVETGATPLRSKAAYYDHGGIPWVTSGALNSLFIDRAEESITELALRETNAKVFPAGTLLVAMYGEGRTRGKVSELRLNAATNQACAALLFEKTSSYCKPYVKLFFQKNYNDIRRLSSGGVQPNLNLAIIKQTYIPIPPLAEQHQIVEEIERRFSIADEVEKVVEQSLKQAERLRQSILKRAFEGKLVSQDPNDEPADKLLERIKQAKMNSVGAHSRAPKSVQMKR